jgi:hypothetical protein
MGALRHFDATATIVTSPSTPFAYLDDPQRLGAHMSQSSWMLLGSTMTYQFDEAEGKAVGAHIRIKGRVLGLALNLDEIVTVREVAARKAWKTVGKPHLLIIGNYEMGFEITPLGKSSQLRIFINYTLPRGPSRILGWLLSGMYARWCVTRMLSDAIRHFAGTPS